ncbi:MAG TPA: hypothetical protein VF101_19295 [Gaiellaceae bacterium]
MRIDFDDPRAGVQLGDVLRANGCAVLESGPRTIHVAPADPDFQSDMELLFFVRAWAGRHPGIVAAAISS